MSVLTVAFLQEPTTLTSWLLLEGFLHSSGGIIATLTFYDLARMWVECIIIMPATIAIVALTFSLYALKPFFPECSPPDESVKLLAVLCITILAFVNCWDVKWATTIQAQNTPLPKTIEIRISSPTQNSLRFLSSSSLGLCSCARGRWRLIKSQRIKANFPRVRTSHLTKPSQTSPKLPSLFTRVG